MFSADANGKNAGYCSSGQGLFVINNGNKAAMMGAWEVIKYFASPEIQVEWDKMTGYLPISDAVYNDADYQAYLKEFPYVQKIIDAMKGADLSAFYAFTATNNTYSPAGATALEEIFNGTPVADAIATMVATINEDFELYNATNVAG
jgi:sn-glycerol 3-phosphate transport system substrate-binding protein